MLDFTRKKLSFDLPESSYNPGLISSPLHFWMPDFISKRLSLGFQQFGRSSHGFLTNEAVMIGVETRQSASYGIRRRYSTSLFADYFPAEKVQGMQVELFRQESMENGVRKR